MPRSDTSDHVPGTVCLTMDVEPDYARTSSFAILDRAGPFFQWIHDEQVPVTAFVMGRLIAQSHPILDQLQSAGAAVELHGYAHDVSGFGDMRSSHSEEIQRGTEAYAKRFGRVPYGYRAPSGIVSADDIRLLDRLGFDYDSSIFPVRRTGRYDFRKLPRRPFRWEGLRLSEFPVALVTSRVPAGLTFTNLLGAGISATLMARSAPIPAGPLVIDGHFHNIFPAPEALAGMPWPFRALYRMGELSGGLAGLMSLLNSLRRRGFALASLTEVARTVSAGDLQSVSLAFFDKS